MCACRGPSRRAVLRGLAAGAATLPLGACGDSFPIRLVSDEEVARLGLQSWQQIRAKTPVSRNQDFQVTLQAVGRRLLAAADEDPRQWQMVVFASAEPNAFVLPGRRMGVNEGMFRLAASHDQLAAVIGHEIGHLLEQHPHERASASMLRIWAQRLLGLVLFFAGINYAGEIAAVLGAGAELGLLRPFSRRQELEADRVGMQLMGKAGFRREEAVALWRRMARLGGGGQPAFLSTHPAAEERIRALEAILAQA